MLIDMLVKRAPIEKDFSCDRKYCAETADGDEIFSQNLSAPSIRRPPGFI